MDLRNCHPHEIVDLVTAVKPGEHMTKSQQKRVRGTATIRYIFQSILSLGSVYKFRSTDFLLLLLLATISLQWTCDDVTDARGGFGRSILTAFGGAGPHDRVRRDKAYTSEGMFVKCFSLY